MGSQQTSTQRQTQTQTADPRTQTAVSSVLDYVPGIASTQYSAGMDPRVADQNAQQLAAIQGLGTLGSNNPASGYISEAANYARMAGDPANIQALTNSYYSPYADKVLAQMQNVFGQQNAQLKGNQAASGAIGGSRAAVADSTLANQQGLAAGQTMANLYNQAQQAALTTAGQQAGAAYSLGNLGQEALGTQLTGLNAALAGGNQLQGQQQNVLTAAQQAEIQRTLFPQQQAAAAANIAGIGALLGGSSSGTGTSSQPVDYTGQILGGLIAGLGAYRSDERTKHDIKPIGQTFDGQTVYTFRYNDDPDIRVGLMAQEVEKKHPDAVHEIDGIKAVDYTKATAESAKLGATKHRAIGGGVGLGNGTTGVMGYSGLQSGLQPYFAQSPQVQVPQMHFPTLNMTQPENKAQQQANQQAQQLMSLGQDLGKQHLGSDLYDFTSNQIPSLGLGLTEDFAANGGAIRHRPFGGAVGDFMTDTFGLSPEDRQALAETRGDAPRATPTTLAPLPYDNPSQDVKRLAMQPAPQPIAAPSSSVTPPPFPQTNLNEGPEQDVTAYPSPLEDFLKRRSERANPIPPTLGADSTPNSNQPPLMGQLSSIPAPGTYYDMDASGRRIGGPQPAAIASPAQTPVPLAAPQPSASPFFEAGHPFYSRLEARESGGNPNAQSETSSAFGPYQVTEGKWNDYIRRHPDLRLTSQDRLNPAVQRANIVPMVQETQRTLMQAGIEPTEANTQMAWTLGDAGAARFKGALDANPKTPADAIVGHKAAAANHSLFYKEDGTPKSVGEVYANFNARPAAPQQQQPSQPQNFIPERQGPSNFQQLMKSMLGYDIGKQPAGFGGMLGRALGQEPSLDQQTSNRLVNMGLGMMAAGPSVGVKGFPGALISGLTAAGKGGQFALGQEQAERKQAIDLANAAMNQKLHEAQISKYEREAKEPKVIGTDTIYDQFGMPHYRNKMGIPDANSPYGWKEIPNQENNGTTSAGGVRSLDAIPGTGDEFVKSAKQAGISPYLVDAANDVAFYKSDPTKLSSFQGHERLIIDRLAHRINPDYDTKKYSAVAAAEKTLTQGKVSQGLSSTGRLFDEIEIAFDRAHKLNNWGSEYANAAAGHVYPSNSDYQAARTGMSTAINNVADAAAAAAKGGAQGAEGDARRRVRLMNPDMHEKPLLEGLRTEAETALKMGQSNLTPYNSAHGFTPDNPKYKTILDYMTPAQQKKAIKLLGPQMIEEITGRPVTEQSGSSALATPTATGKNGEKYILQNGQWVQQ